ncbi:MAG: hypothetical protein RLY35_2059, partial [Bacteroidota bacterium]
MIQVKRLMFLLLAGLSIQAWSQSISGTVKDEKNIPLPGVVVSVNKLGKGTQTDVNGKYTLDLPAGNHTVSYTLIGFKIFESNITLIAGQKLPLDIKMFNDDITLDNLEIVGYGIERNKPTTGAVSKINGKDVTAVRTPSFEAALQGQAAGLQISQGSGMAGSGSIVRIRGISSISAGGDPLYIV